MSVAEQRYQAVLAVISDGATVTEVAARFGVARKTVHDWLAKYEAGGLENQGDRSYRRILADLFSGTYKTMDVLKLKDIVNALEKAIDALESVANTVEQIAVKES